MADLKQGGQVTPSDVARYFLARTAEDGELISPLKMQKLVYYAYAWYLVKQGSKLFDEQIEAWANGPVVPSLYREFKKFGSSPINIGEVIGMSSQKDIEEFQKSLPGAVKTVLDEVYEKYQTMTAFELVVSTHHEKPWIEARKGLAPNENSNRPILDEHIIESLAL